jgi:hypothetical protein
MGTLICMSSMSPRRQDLMHGVIYVPFGLILCGLLSSTTIFMYLSHFCLESGLDINNPGLHLSGP